MCDFVEWLALCLRRDFLLPTADEKALSIYAHLRQYRNTADLLLARGHLLDMLNDCVPFHRQEEVADELINRYHLADIAQCAEEVLTDSGVCPSPELEREYDSAFPPLLMSQPIHVPNTPADDISFDGTSPRFVVPLGYIPQPPLSSLPVAAGYHPFVLPPRLRMASMSDVPLPPPFCVPRIDEPASHLVPVNGHTHFAPIRSESMSWAYNEEGGLAPDSRHITVHDAIECSTDKTYAAWEAEQETSAQQDEEWHRVWQRQSVDPMPMLNIGHGHTTPSDDWIEEEQLLSFVGGIASTAPLLDGE